MTDILFIDNYFKSVITRLKNMKLTIDKYFLVRSEPELAADIKQLTANEFFLAILIPSSDTKEWNLDNIKENEGWLIYALEKSDRKAITQETRLSSVALQQRIITIIKQMLRADVENRTIPCNIRPDFDSMHTDPEGNFHGCEGYSVSFRVESNDFFATNL